MNEEIERLKQQVDELQHRDLAMHFAYRVLARTLAEKLQLDMQLQQAKLRHAAEELEQNPAFAERVPEYLNNLADNLLSDHFVFLGMSREEANNKVYQTRNMDD
ncbi:hypothetical protein [Rheinheimera maricola]|uniref:Uncharacterized protein n=1 Tax=Rheinheimera maricola TaxID=2793282 RepID=A0ABS7X6N8_9GAMM|nr:hypothetical protein [Rheinheimera maricola]MBZ9610785.1 hypothetical protein [Rheinheimera maricola]